ncbi:TetR/AcrR family transcriptional regulator [Ruegeria sp. PrR005]|uniref:TetR/AcrR family transcriptional regulator n=1 Tax=Ruegeria sp. PrR005 TaxID=2706882 RepID=A0A6B2NLS5_9RHOB|nr:TetR/AcrR family transcriptional regulator [Ruegeria sp. PrR005]
MFVLEKQRQRAPSARSLQTRARILDAAEQFFAARGFEGASIRDIAKAAGVQGGLVAHHGGSKEELFHLIVARRAGELSRLRIEALETARACAPLNLGTILDCFVRPYVELAQGGDPRWVAYGRLVAHVSADPRWRDLAAECFDPTAQRFIAEIAALFPGAPPGTVAAGQVYAVSAMLAHVHSAWRIGALSPGSDAVGLDRLIAFCTAGVYAILTSDT